MTDKRHDDFDAYLEGNSEISDLYAQSRARIVPESLAGKVLEDVQQRTAAPVTAVSSGRAANLENNTVSRKTLWPWALAASIVLSAGIYWLMPQGQHETTAPVRLAGNDNLSNVEGLNAHNGQQDSAPLGSRVIPEHHKQSLGNETQVALQDDELEPKTVPETGDKQPEQMQNVQMQKELSGNVAKTEVTAHDKPSHNEPALKQDGQQPIEPGNRNTAPRMVAESNAGDIDNSAGAMRPSQPEQTAGGDAEAQQSVVAQAALPEETPDTGPESGQDADNADYSLSWMDRLAARTPERAQITRPTANRLSPQQWLDKITRLHERQRYKEAAASLKEFRKLYPRYRIPDILRDMYERP